MKLTAELTQKFSIHDLLKRFKLSTDCINFITENVETLTLGKGEYFSVHGKYCKRIGLLFKGLLYACYYPQDRTDEVVSRFFYETKNIIVTSFESFTEEKLSEESIIAIEDSYLLCISSEKLFELYDRYPEINYVVRELAQQSYIQAMQRVHNLQTMSSKEKVRDFLSKNPGLFNRVKRQQVASYLGINRNDLTKYANLFMKQNLP